MKLRTNILAAALASSALAVSGAALAQAGTVAGTTANGTVQKAPASVGGHATDSTAVTGMHTGTNAGAGPAGYTHTREMTGVGAQPNPSHAAGFSRNADMGAPPAADASQLNTSAKGNASVTDTNYPNKPTIRAAKHAGDMNGNAGANESMNGGANMSGAMQADTGQDNAMLMQAASLKGRAVVGSGGDVIGTVTNVKKNPSGFTEVDVRTSQRLGLQGKVVQLPARIFKYKPGQSPHGNLKAPTVSKADLRSMPTASAAPAANPM